MKDREDLDRRQFVQIAAVSAAAGTAGCSSAGAAYRVLTDHEAATIRSLANQIVPPDDYPGAGDAGADRFIDTQLAGHYARYREAYGKGITEIDEAARGKHGAMFVELEFDKQQALLAEREDTEFFRLIREHSMQAFYGDPRHGGNPDAISWRMLGVPDPPVRGREQYDLRDL